MEQQTPLSSPDPLYHQLEMRLAAWAAQRPDVRAVVLIGSRARSDHPADAWSDLDTIIFVDENEVYTRPGNWQDDLEDSLALPVWFGAYSQTGRGDPEWEYVLSGGYKVDLVFTPNLSSKGHQASLQEMAELFPYRHVFERGARVLLEKGPMFPAFEPPAAPPDDLPDQSAFHNRISTILLDLVRAARLALRGELWRAARAMNEHVQSSLLELLEWHARAQSTPRAARWRYGRFLEEWADPRALEILPAVYANNTFSGVQQAVLAALRLLDWLGPETAARLSLVYPEESVGVTSAWLRDLLQDMPARPGSFHSP